MEDLRAAIEEDRELGCGSEGFALAAPVAAHVAPHAAGAERPCAGAGR